MIKMVITDVDGTLIPEGTKDFPEELLELVRRLQKQGIRFATASGRQFRSLYALFESVAEDMLFFCENGTIVCDGTGNILDSTPIPRAAVAEIMQHIIEFSDTELLMGAMTTSYICPKSDAFVHLMRDIKNSHVTEITSMDEVTEDICKISAYCPSGSEKFYAYLQKNWKPVCRLDASAENWLDFSVANKADGIRKMLEKLDIAPQDVMYFGDNYNDCEVLDMVGEPWLMSMAAPELKERFPQQTDSVVKTLKDFVEALEAQIS